MTTYQGYTSSNGRDEAKALMGFYMEREPGELTRLVDALDMPARRKERARFLKHVQLVIPDLDNVKLRPDELGRHVYVSRGPREQPLYRSGAGITNVLYICGRVIQALRKLRSGHSPSGIIIVDEPETGLHPDFHNRLMQLASGLYEQHGIQWLAGTHSPYLLGGSLTVEDKVHLLQIESNRTAVRPIISDDDTKAMYESIGFYLPSILGSAAVLFVEGPSEVAFLRAALPKVDIDVSKLRWVIVPLSGDQLSYVEPPMLARVHPQIYVWLDSEKNSPDEEISDSRKAFLDSSQLTTYIDSAYRSLENTYPPRASAEAMACPTVLRIEPFESWGHILGKFEACGAKRVIKKKPLLAQAVVTHATQEELTSMPVIEHIRQWLTEAPG